jgi:hypothetical protein
MQKTLSVFCLWNNYVKTLNKDHRYSLGLKISTLFTDVIEQVSLAQFSNDTYRTVYIERAIAKNDTLKFMIFTLYELHALDEKKFIELSSPVEEIGKMLYGWKRNIESKKKSP